MAFYNTTQAREDVHFLITIMWWYKSRFPAWDHSTPKGSVGQKWDFSLSTWTPLTTQ